MSTNIHNTAEIDEGCHIGEGTKVWHWTHISSKVIIGENCSLGQNVFIGNNVTIGKNCKIQNNVSIYDGVHLDDYIFCGPSMVFTNVMNPRSEFSKKNQYKKTIVKKGVTFGANSTIVCGITIGEYAFIGAGSLVNKNIKPYSLVVGVPFQQIGWMSKFGEKLDLPIEGSGIAKCYKTGCEYELINGNLKLKEENEN
tara:strand:- start:619 stop:1209 length:591 start_codon:yes stop_codon:yes gene_type:complete